MRQATAVFDERVGAAGDRPSPGRRRPWVEAVTGVSGSTLSLWCRTGRFPKPVQLGPRAVAWRESDVLEWLGTRPEVAGSGDGEVQTSARPAKLAA
jgi:prophage regulatory protein